MVKYLRLTGTYLNYQTRAMVPRAQKVSVLRPSFVNCKIPSKMCLFTLLFLEDCEDPFNKLTITYRMRTIPWKGNVKKRNVL